MRQKRVKSYRKVMQLYCSTFGFREPYQLLVDAEFCKSCVQQKLDFQARLEDVLQGGVKPMITQCCMESLYAEGATGQAAVDLAKRFERRKCNHFKTRPQDECMTEMAGKDNKNRYVIATQSPDLRKSLRSVPGLPLIYINRSVVLLETPSDQTMNKKKSLESSKLHAPASELALLSKTPVTSNSSALIDAPYASTSALPTSDVVATESTAPPIEQKKKKVKGPKGPNPLSMKKKKPDPNSNTSKKRARVEEVKSQGSGEGKKRPRIEEEGGKVQSLAVRATGGEGEAGEGEAKRRKRKRGRKDGGAGVTEKLQVEEGKKASAGGQGTK